MLRYFVLLLLFCLGSFITAQHKQDYRWIMGGATTEFGDSVDGFMFDFDQKPMEIVPVNMALGILDNNTIICDTAGNLLFFTNGQAIMNSNMQVMLNGDGINAGEWQQLFWPNPRLGYPGYQDVIILSDPGYDKGYYLIHKARVYNQGGTDSTEIRMSYVDMNLDEGLGYVLFKNQRFHQGRDLMAGYTTAIQHANGSDWWLIEPRIEDSIFYVFKLDQEGISKISEQNAEHYFSRARSSAAGTAKFSPDGTKYAWYNYYEQLHLYDFDRETGSLSNHQEIAIYPEDSIDINQFYFGSVEWSSNSRFIYAASSIKLHQVDTWEENIQNGVRLIDTYNGTLDPFTTRFARMEQGPDCKIYIAAGNGAYSMHVINKPNELGTACDFVQNGISLPYPNGNRSLPNHPRFRVDEEEKCDPDIVSVLGQPVYYKRPLQVYPNPSSGFSQVVFPSDFTRGKLVVLGVDGRIYQETQIDFPQVSTTLDLTSLPSGLYFVELYPSSASERIFYSTKLVKME